MPSPETTDKNVSDWLAVLRTVWSAENLDEDLETALFHYLADLKVVEATVSGHWRLATGIPAPGGIEENVRAVIENRAQTESGFALVYFLPGSSEIKEAADSAGKAGSPSGSRSGISRPEGLPKKSADPSNLQIVKKVGRQMEDFIELEKTFLERLQGEHTTKKDARKIFNFALSQIKHKAKPQPWEQLSRRRHR